MLNESKKGIYSPNYIVPNFESFSKQNGVRKEIFSKSQNLQNSKNKRHLYNDNVLLNGNSEIKSNIKIAKKLEILDQIESKTPVNLQLHTDFEQMNEDEKFRLHEELKVNQEIENELNNDDEEIREEQKRIVNAHGKIPVSNIEYFDKVHMLGELIKTMQQVLMENGKKGEWPNFGEMEGDPQSQNRARKPRFVAKVCRPEEIVLLPKVGEFGPGIETMELADDIKVWAKFLLLLKFC
ncbi:hypothetical protein MHBO_004610 [Bonamia ostreae]|uniref:Uncharacterized protein n=1 Tax=Bonamia ostreae TaxID=126728 RepID=A0ABV2ATS7_9EUKA